MSRLVLSVAKPNRTRVTQTRVKVADGGQSGYEGERPMLLGFAVFSPTYGLNRPLADQSCFQL
jgi:hypothetical protein